MYRNRPQESSTDKLCRLESVTQSRMGKGQVRVREGNVKTRFQSWSLFVVLFFVLLLSSCGSQSGSGQGDLRFQVNSYAPQEDIDSLTLKHFGDRVTELSDGRIQFQYHWSGSLVPIDQTFQGVRDGLTDISTQAMSYASGEIPDVAVLEVPFSWPIDSENMRAFHEEINPTVDEILQENGQKLLMANPAIMPAVFECNDSDRFLASEEDWEGTLMRTSGRYQSATVEAWGGRAVNIPLGDLYTALERGTTNCTLLIYNFVDSLRMYEPAPFVTRTDHAAQYISIDMNLEKWNQLTDEDKEIFQQAAAEAYDFGLQLRDDRLDRTLEELQDSGVEFCTPDAEEFDRLRNATEPVLDQIRQEVSPQGEKIMNVAANYRDVVTERPDYGPNNPCP